MKIVKILMLSQTVFPPDIRLEKEIRSLHSHNYRVTVLCNQFEKNKNPDFKYCNIVRIRALSNSKFFNKLINFPLFINPRFLYYSLKAFFKTKPNIIHAHDLPMVPIALFLKIIKNIPVVYDMHENYPEALKAFKKRGIFNLIFKNPIMAKLIDQICLKLVDKVIVVIEENRENLINLGVNPEKIVVVSNYVDTKSFVQENIDPIITEKYSNNFTLLYTGTVSPERDLETAVKSIPSLYNKITNIKLVIIGEGPSVTVLKKLVQELKIEIYVDLLKWPGHENLASYISSANLCIIPQPYNDYINTTIPHKLFEYMLLKKAVLVSDAKPLKRIIAETGAGLIFKSCDQEDFAEKVYSFYQNQNNHVFGENAYRAIETKYNWENEKVKLLNVYTELIGSNI